MIHQASARIVKNPDVVGLESLQVKSMTARAKGTAEDPGSRVAQKAGLNRAVLDRGWGEFARQCGWLQARMERRAGGEGTGGVLEPGVQRVRDRRCGHTQHADTNADIIIRQRALAQLGLEPCGPGHHWRPAAGMVAAAPGEFCTGISAKGEENRGACIPGNDPNKASGVTAGALPQ